jgi:hypothetical protein
MHNADRIIMPKADRVVPFALLTQWFLALVAQWFHELNVHLIDHVQPRVSGPGAHIAVGSW